MLKSHFNAVEKYLLALKKIGDNTGHPLHKGTPREAFIQEFLKNHLSEKVSIGTGEIIDCNSKPGEKRNQHDIIIYKREYPKIDFGGDIKGFLAESVVATIEVKSELSEKELNKAINAARKVKKLNTGSKSGFGTGWNPPAPLNFVVAYKGPAKMITIYNRLQKIYEAKKIKVPVLPTTLNERQNIPASAIDAIFILGKGFMQFDNFPISLVEDEDRKKYPSAGWSVVETKNAALLMLFITLTQAVAGSWLKPFNALPYLSTFNVPSKNLQFK